MNKTDMTQIDRIFYPGWLMASQLRCGQDVQEGEALYRRASRMVKEAGEQLTEAGYSEISRDHMLYALCALLDESVMNRGSTDDGYLTWRRDPLQAHFFGTLNAGEELWERIRIQLKDPAPDLAVLTCLYRTLQLGFVGQYREENDEHREDLVRALGERVSAPPSNSSPGLPNCRLAGISRTVTSLYSRSSRSGRSKVPRCDNSGNGS